jgi:hypothetical protein
VSCGKRRVIALHLLISSRAIYPIPCTRFVAICFFDLSSYLAENAFCRRCKNQSRRDILDVTILRRETGSSRRETCPGFTLSPTNLTWTGLGSKSNLCGERQATNCPNQDTASAPYANWLTFCCQRDKGEKPGKLSKKNCALSKIAERWMEKGFRYVVSIQLVAVMSLLKLQCWKGSGYGHRVWVTTRKKTRCKNPVICFMFLHHFLMFLCPAPFHEIISGHFQSFLTTGGVRSKCWVFLISIFRRVLYVVCFLLGDSPASEFYKPTFRNTLSVPSS